MGHAEPLKALRSKECEGYKGPEMTAPSMEDMNKALEEHVIRATLASINLKNGAPALTLFGDHTHLHINPSGKFIIGGPQGDAGLTGRKIIIDTYGGWGAHGGGAFSGKDPTKVDRSAAYICRQMAKSVVQSGLCKRALVQLSYAIGVAKPLSLFVETYGTEQGALTTDDITNVVKMEFDCRPGAIAHTRSQRTKIPGNGSILPFWSRAHHKRWDKIFRVGKRERSEAVQGDEFGSGHCCTDREQLPYKMGGLSIRFSCVVLDGARTLFDAFFDL